MDRDKGSARQEFLQNFLRKMRKESHQTQVELARKLQRPQTYVSKYELGERRLDLLEIYDICNACDVPFGEFAETVEMEFRKFDVLK